MSELSPAAEAVWEAFNKDEAGVFVDYGEKLAAALRAAADQLFPKPDYWDEDNMSEQGLQLLRLKRDQILAIADELEAQ